MLDALLTDKINILIIFLTIGLRYSKRGKVYIPVLPQSHVRYLQRSHVCVAYTIIAPLSGKSLLLKLKKRENSKVANFAMKKKPVFLTGYTFVSLCSVSWLCNKELELYPYSCMMYVSELNSWHFKKLLTLPV